MIEAPSIVQDQSMDPQSPIKIIQKVLVSYEPESVHPSTAKEEEEVEVEVQMKSIKTKASIYR